MGLEAEGPVLIFLPVLSYSEGEWFKSTGLLMGKEQNPDFLTFDLKVKPLGEA